MKKIIILLLLTFFSESYSGDPLTLAAFDSKWRDSSNYLVPKTHGLLISSDIIAGTLASADTNLFNSKALTNAQIAYLVKYLDSNGVNGWYRRGYVDALLSAKQNAATILTTFGGLANASGYLSNNGSGTLSWGNPAGSGDIEGVTAGVGLQGGGTSGTVTINASPSYRGGLRNDSDSLEIDPSIVPALSGGNKGLAYRVNDSTIAIIAPGVDSAEINYLDGATENIQTRLTSLRTRTYTWSVLDTVKTGGESLPGWKVPQNITITEISAYTDANTVTFNLEERGEATPNTSGTNVMGSSLVADNDQQETTSFTNAGIAINAWLVPVISAAGDVTIFSITIRYTID